MTLTEKAVCTLYTGISFCYGEDFSAVYEYAERLLERPILTHELGSEYITRRLKDLSKNDFVKICRDVDLDFTVGSKEEEDA